jgi:hypothetical protein
MLRLRCTDPAGARKPFVTSISLDERQIAVPPGRWDLSFHFGDADEAFRIDGVDADAGVETHDPRLMAFDWKPFAALVSLRVEDPRGQPCDDCSVGCYVTSSRGQTGSSSAPRNGRFRMLVPKAGAQIVVKPREGTHRNVDLGAFTGERTVNLVDTVKVALQLSDMPKLPDDVHLTAWLLDSSGRVSGQQIEVDAAGKAVLRPASIGKLHLQLVLRRGSNGRQLGMNGLAPVEVGEQDMEFAFAIPDALAKEIRQQLDRWPK